MSQSKLQVYTAEANPILESSFNTLLGQETTFTLGAATETKIDQIKSDAATTFSIVGHPEGAETFIVQLDAEWIPVISNAMVGREMTPFEEGVFDLTGQIISQNYEHLKSEHARYSDLPPLEAQPFAPGSWNPDDSLATDYWAIPFELVVAELTLKGKLYATSAFVTGLETIAATPNAVPQDATQATENSPDENIGVSTPKFPDFGRESLQQEGPGNFDLLAEVELNVTVELGRRKIPLSEVLKLTTGSVIELEKLVGEPLEIFANGRLIAEGEAVVIEEQFGIRITNLASNKIRAKALV